jgi:single-strand DNA-binding protein
MAELNKVMLIGRLTKDPELRYTPAGAAVAQIRMAVNHTYRSKEEKKEEVLYIDVSIFGRSAETAKQYLAKGRELFIEGRLQQNDWEDKSGQKRTTYRVVADRFQFLGGGTGRGAGGPAREMAAEEGGPPPEMGAESMGAGDAPRGDSGPPPEDDLPF